MGYSKSRSRKDFEERIRELKSNSREAALLGPAQHHLRDMVYQCAIFQTSAAVETYLRLLIETWIQHLKHEQKDKLLPDGARGFIALTRLSQHFKRYAFDDDENNLINRVVKEHKAWPLMDSSVRLPNYFDGKTLHAKVAYPTLRNIKRLSNRVGLGSIEAELSRRLNRDVEVLIESFQSVRTALAHAAPPTITFVDVRRLLGDMDELVKVLDRTFYGHVMRHGGAACWK